MSSNGYLFQIVNQQVTQVFEIDRNGRRWLHAIDADESYAVDGEDVIRTERDHDGVEITRYSDADHDGQYLRVSESEHAPSDERHRSESHHHDDHTESDADDSPEGLSDTHAGLSYEEMPASTGATAPQTCSAGADRFVVTQLQGNLVIQGFNSAQGDTLVFDLGGNIQSLAQLIHQVSDIDLYGQDLVVEFNAGQSHLTLVGVGAFGIGLEHVQVIHSHAS